MHPFIFIFLGIFNIFMGALVQTSSDPSISLAVFNYIVGSVAIGYGAVKYVYTNRNY